MLPNNQIIQNSTQLYNTLQNASQLYKTLKKNKNIQNFYTSAQNSTKLDKTLEKYKKCTILTKHTRRYTTFLFLKPLQKFTQLVQHFSRLYNTLHNLQDFTTLYKTSQHFTKLHNTLQYFTILYNTAQYFTELAQLCTSLQD